MLPEPQNDWIAEEVLADELGLPREAVARARELLPADCVDRDGPWVVWKKDAASAYAFALGLEWPLAHQQTELETAELTVESNPAHAGNFHYSNPRIILAKKTDGTQVWVNVMTSENFRRGMKFRARQKRSDTTWELTGREPRREGKW